MIRTRHWIADRSKSSFRLSEAAEAFITLGYLEARLRGGKILHVARDPAVASEFLLDWLEPRRFVTHEVGTPRGIAQPDHSCDGVLAFLALSDVREDSTWVSELARVLVPGGILVICEVITPELRDRPVWRALRGRIARMRFELIEERLCAPYVLVANSVGGHTGAATPDAEISGARACR